MKKLTYALGAAAMLLGGILAAPPASAAPPVFDLDHLPQYRAALMRAADPQSQAIRQELADGPADLARAEASARRAGILLGVPYAEPPADKDAAPLYALWASLTRPGATHEPLYAEPLFLQYAYTPGQIAAAKLAAASVGGSDDILNGAVQKPDLSIGDPADLNGLANFSVFANTRAAARQITSEASLLALDGKSTDAVRTQAKGYLIEAQLERKPTLISYLVGVAVEGIATRGLSTLLSRGAPDAQLAREVGAYAAMATNPGAAKLAVQEDAAAEVHLTDKYIKNAPSSAPGHLYLPADRTLLTGIVDVAEARYLNDAVSALAVADQPPMQRQADLVRLQAAENAPSRIKNDPADTLRADFYEEYAKFFEHEDFTTAQQQMLLAAAAVLTAKAQTGQYLAVLPGSFTDPFSGKPLVYIHEAAGFEVYSVGPGGKFDGEPTRKPYGHELAFQYPAPKPIPVPSNLL